MTVSSSGLHINSNKSADKFRFSTWQDCVYKRNYQLVNVEMKSTHVYLSWENLKRQTRCVIGLMSSNNFLFQKKEIKSLLFQSNALGCIWRFALGWLLRDQL